jgi:hypothetical protein
VGDLAEFVQFLLVDVAHRLSLCRKEIEVAGARSDPAAPA